MYLGHIHYTLKKNFSFEKRSCEGNFSYDKYRSQKYLSNGQASRYFNDNSYCRI